MRRTLPSQASVFDLHIEGLALKAKEEKLEGAAGGGVDVPLVAAIA